MRAAVRADRSVDFGKQWQGQTVDGRYPLEQYLGGSDRTAVFLTNLPADAKAKAAIKLVRASGGEAEALLSNWKRAAQLSHPHLLRLFDGGQCWLSGNELLFVVTEYADENLAQVVPHRALTASETEAMLRPTIEALAYLHDADLVHGHLCPANVMAAGDRLKLSSDGIQAAGARPEGLEGTPYSAPELSSGQLSPPADVWSLGVLLVESLTQHLPRPEVAPRGIPQAYAEIVGRTLVKDPSKRSTVREIAKSIRLQLPEAGTSKPPKPETHPLEEPELPSDSPRGGSRRVRGLVFFLIAVAILAITLTVKLLNQHPASPGLKNSPSTSQAESATISSRPAAETPQTSSAPGGSVQAGAVLHQMLPNVSPGALRTIQGHVKVKLHLKVDARGTVSEARFASAGPSQYFARHAMDAARQWTFTPPLLNGQAGSSDWNLLFEFSRGGVKAFPEQVRTR
ncbi:MAG TPA: TonB family protein [Terriglobales bacterium]|jgi:TonB family protein|nr:TonB family protein [Terriglobales bacterium]